MEPSRWLRYVSGSRWVRFDFDGEDRPRTTTIMDEAP